MSRTPTVSIGFAALVALLTSGPALALDPEKKLSQYSLASWDAKQGLANGGILCITQSADGYLWLGTRRGLVRFDGTDFQLFDHKTSAGLIGSNVFHIETRRDGSLLFSTAGGAGLIEYRKGRFSAYPLPELPKRNIRVFHEGRNGVLWIGTSNSGLARIENGKLKIYSAADGVSSNIKAILESKDGSVWVATYGDGAVQLAGGRIRRYGIQQGLPSNDVRAIWEDADGTLWFSTLSGLARWRDGRFTTFTEKDGLSHNRVFPLWRDRDGNLWIGTEGGGINRMSGGRFRSLTTRDGLTTDEIRSVFEDREGDVWFGSSDGALFRLKDEGFTVFTRKEGLSSEVVRAVYEDRAGSVWLATAAGVNVLRNGSAQRAREAWADGMVTTMIQDRNRGFWFGTLGHGLRWVQDGRTKTFFPDRTVNTLFEDKDGAVWAGLSRGLERIANGRAETIGSGTAIGRARVVAVLQDEEGAIWAAGASGVVQRIQGAQVSTFSLREGGPGARATSLHLDGSGNLWIGSTDGLWRLSAGKLQHFSSVDGLVEDQVSSILEDNQGFLWLSGYQGFSRIAKSALLQFRQGSGSRLPVWFIERANGVATSSGNQMPSAWKGRDGRLWFGSLRGLILIEPDKAHPDPLPVPVLIEQLLADRSPMSRTGSSSDPLRLDAGVRDIEFRFVGLSLSNPSGVRFKYKLEGYDNEWTEAGSRRMAFYTNLPSGSYKFRVMAANRDGLWNEQPATLAFVKDAHFYELWWVRLLFAAALGGSIWVAYRTRVAGLRKRFEAVLAERNRIARELHDTVEQGLTGVMLQLDTVAAHWSSAPDVARRGLDLARNMARHCMGEARSAVRDLRSESRNAGDAVAELRRMALEFGSAATPAIRVNVQGDPAPLPRDIEMTLLRIGQEALTNAVKHARATRIDLDVHFAADAIGLRVRDDGVGFSAESSMLSAASGHFGLLGMRERANKVGGKLVIQSRSGGGTGVDFLVPRDGKDT